MRLFLRSAAEASACPDRNGPKRLVVFVELLQKPPTNTFTILTLRSDLDSKITVQRPKNDKPVLFFLILPEAVVPT